MGARVGKYSIWKLKSRLLRALAAVALFPLMVLFVLSIVLVAICAGVGEGFSYAWYVFSKERTMRPTLLGWWRAVTFRSTPC